MSLISTATIGAAPSWTAVTIPSGVDATLRNIADEAIEFRFEGAGDTHSLAVGDAMIVPGGAACEARCASGGKTLQILSGAEPV